ncbi:MAG: 1-hydroxycarotenoid 3,4-desaturase CrtD [Gammaproteobacteria bacterium]
MTSRSNKRDKNKHVIVVGAGMGGLASACELAANGVRVTLLERHAKPGGKMRQIQVGDALIDSGPTVFTMRWIFDALFEAAGTSLEEHLTLLPEETLARHAWLDGSQLDLYADVDRSVEAIADFAGRGEARAYKKFARQSQSIFETLDKSFMRARKPSPVELALSLGITGVPKLYATKPFVSLWHELGQLFSDPRLRQLFGRYATYCGSSPLEAPATLMLIAHAERSGVWLVDGGMQKLASALAELARSHGAMLQFNADVKTLNTKGGRVTGVTLADGEKISADAVVFNGDTQALSQGLLGKTAKKAAKSRTDTSLSAITWSMLARPKGFDLAHHTVFFGDDYTDEFDSLFDRKDVTALPTVYVCAQDRGPGRTTDELERVFCLVNAPARELSADEAARYKERMDNILARNGLTFTDVQPGSTITTPNDFAQLFPATQGALYGRPTHGWNGSFSRPGERSKIEGLYFAGGSVHPGPGVPMTAMSGRLAAASVMADFDV